MWQFFQEGQYTMAFTFLAAVIFALTFHEAAHAWMAKRCGDWTAKLQGRLTLNPIVHLDPIGSLCFLILPFGWAKPVPVDVRNLREPKRDMMLVALAGPISNLVLAVVFLALYWILVLTGLALASTTAMAVVGTVLETALVFCWVAVFTNLILALFNMLPVFPLDGEKVLVGLLPWRQSMAVESLRSYSMVILLVILLSGVFSRVIDFVVMPLMWFLL